MTATQRVAFDRDGPARPCMPRNLVRMFRAPIGGIALACALAAGAAPYKPTSDDQVVERLPLRASDSAARELAQLRAAWRRDPTAVPAAVRLAEAYIDQAGAEG